MIIASLDHLVLTVSDITKTCAFYSRLGFHPESFQSADGTVRTALKFGSQKINLHEAGHEPKAKMPTPGSGDLCFISPTPLADVIAHLENIQVEVELGPVVRTGAVGKLNSVYVRDPDQNLIEISNQV